MTTIAMGVTIHICEIDILFSLLIKINYKIKQKFYAVSDGEHFALKTIRKNHFGEKSEVAAFLPRARYTPSLENAGFYP